MLSGNRYGSAPLEVDPCGWLEFAHVAVPEGQSRPGRNTNLATDLYVVIAKITGTVWGGLAAGLGAFVVLVLLWHVMPLALRLRVGPERLLPFQREECTIKARDQTSSPRSRSGSRIGQPIKHLHRDGHSGPVCKVVQ
jgi:hypothetical protein